MKRRAQMASTAPRLQGFAVLEALLTASALALGLLAATRLAERAWQASAHSRAHAQAQLLAREALDCVLAEPASAGLRCPAKTQRALGHTDFDIALEYTRQAPALQEVWVQVSWPQAGSAAPQRLRWVTRVVDTPGNDAAPSAGTGVALGVSSGP